MHRSRSSSGGLAPPPRFLVLLLLGGAIGSSLADGSVTTEPEVPEPPTTVERRLTDWPGNENSPRFSPDGRWLAFDAEVDGQTDLYLLSLVDGEIRRLTDTASSDRRPAWSPDGRTIAFQSNRTGRWAIWSVEVQGGEPRLVFGDENLWAIAPDWSSAGRLVATVIEPDPSTTYGHATPWLLPHGENVARSLTSGGDEWYARWTADGHRLVYYKGRNDLVETVDVTDGDVRSLSRGEYVGWRPVVSPNGRSVAFASNVGRWRPSLWLAAIENPANQLRLTSRGDDDMPSWSPDSRWIAFSSDRARTEIVAVDLATRERTTIVHDGSDPQPLADDGLAYLQAERGDWRLMVAPAGAPSATEIATPPGGLEAFAIAADGHSVAYIAGGPRPRHRSDLYRTDLRDRSSRRLTELGQVTNPVWCDGGALLFSSYGPSEDEFRQIFRLELASDTLLQLTRSPRDKAPLQCGDGARRITARWTSDATGVYVLEREGEAWEEHLAADGSEGRWSPDGRRLAYVATVDGRTDLFVLSADGTTERVTDDALVEQSVGWSADGRSLIFAARSSRRDLWMIEVPPLPWRTAPPSPETAPTH